MVSKPKRQVLEDHVGEFEDRISGLPDSVLSHILSPFRTRFAVRTSILSKRWRNIWAYVPNLYFHEEDFSDSVAFFMFVQRVLHFRDPSDIKKFHLFCPRIEHFSNIDGWIRTAIAHNVVELDLRVETSGCGDNIIELPKSLFTCETLKVLKLRSNFITDVPTSGCFPSLLFLHVTFHKPDKDSLWSMGKLFSCCPVLEDLSIVGNFQHEAILNFKISAPELKTLLISFRTDHNYDHEYNLFVTAPKLENLNLYQNVLPNFFWESEITSVAKATIDLIVDHFEDDEAVFANHAAALLAGISNVRYLSLSAHWLEVSCLPTFDNLSELKLVVHDCCYWWVELLKRSPKLKYLVIEVGNNCYDKYYSDIEEEEEYEEYEEYEEEEEVEEEEEYDDSTEYPWNPPAFVPKCLSSHLKTISINEFRGRQNEMEAAKYFLENGEVLDKMTISTTVETYVHVKEEFGRKKEIKEFQPEKEIEELCKEFLMFPRGSKTCQVEFI